MTNVKHATSSSANSCGMRHGRQSNVIIVSRRSDKSICTIESAAIINISTMSDQSEHCCGRDKSKNFLSHSPQV